MQPAAPNRLVLLTGLRWLGSGLLVRFGSRWVSQVAPLEQPEGSNNALALTGAMTLQESVGAAVSASVAANACDRWPPPMNPASVTAQASGRALQRTCLARQARLRGRSTRCGGAGGSRCPLSARLAVSGPAAARDASCRRSRARNEAYLRLAPPCSCGKAGRSDRAFQGTASRRDGWPRLWRRAGRPRVSQAASLFRCKFARPSGSLWRSVYVAVSSWWVSGGDWSRRALRGSYRSRSSVGGRQSGLGRVGVQRHGRGYPSDCPCTLAPCHGRPCTTQGPTGNCAHGSPTMRRVWTTWTGCAGRTASCAHTAAVSPAGRWRMACSAALGVAGGCRAPRARSSRTPARR